MSLEEQSKRVVISSRESRRLSRLSEFSLRCTVFLRPARERLTLSEKMVQENEKEVGERIEEAAGGETAARAAEMSRKEKRKAMKKMKRKQVRKEIAEKEREEAEAKLNDPVEQERLKAIEEEEARMREKELKEFEESERAWREAMEIKRKKEVEEEAKREEEEKRWKDLNELRKLEVVLCLLSISSLVRDCLLWNCDGMKECQYKKG